MKTLKLSDGSTIEFEPLKYNEANLIKVDLSDSEGNEGIWAVISDEDKVKYQANSTDKFVFMLANDSLAFYPNPSWGLHLVGEFRGSQRPVSKVEWTKLEEKEDRIWSLDVPEEGHL